MSATPRFEPLRHDLWCYLQPAQPSTSIALRSYLLRCREQWLLVDPGPRSGFESMVAALAALGLESDAISLVALLTPWPDAGSSAPGFARAR